MSVARENPDLPSFIAEEAEKKGINVSEIYTELEKVLEVIYKPQKVHITINRKTGKIEAVKRWLVIEDDKIAEENVYCNDLHKNKEIIPNKKFSVFKSDDPEEVANDGRGTYDGTLCLSAAIPIFPEAQAGQIYVQPMPDIVRTRLGARLGKQLLSQAMFHLDMRKHYKDYKPREGEIISGVIVNIVNGNVTVKLNGGVEGRLPHRSCIQGELLREGSKIKAYIEKVVYSENSLQIILSRTHPEFLAGLFKLEVPEVYDSIVEIKKVVRDPGSRAKVAVYSADKNIDAVGSCVGIRGARVQAISAELNGEKIDIIEYSPDIAEFVVRAISPAKVIKVILDDDEYKIELIMPKDQLSLAIGRQGQNVQLASMITGWRIDVLSEEDASKRRFKEFYEGTKLFMDALNVEEVIAQLLVTEGFMQVEDLANSEVMDIACIEGFDYNLAQELHSRAIQYLQERKKAIEAQFESLHIEKTLSELPHLTEEQLLQLGKNGVLNLEDVAALSRDDLVDIIGINVLKREQLDQIILTARSRLGWLDN